MGTESRRSVAALTRLRQELSEDRKAMAVRAGELDEAASRLDDPPWASHAAVALHAWYTGLESALERVARALDAEVPEGERWHRDLLSQVTVELPGVRPAVLPRSLLAELTELLAFRHFFRHAYSAALDPAKIAEEVARVGRIRPEVDAGLERLDSHLEDTIEALPDTDA